MCNVINEVLHKPRSLNPEFYSTTFIAIFFTGFFSHIISKPFLISLRFSRYLWCFSPSIHCVLLQVVSLTAWTASALLMVPIIMYANIVENTSCNILWPDSGLISGLAAFTLYSFILGFAVPLLLIFMFYFLVIRKLKTVGPKNKSKEKKKSHRKVTKLVLTVIAVYVLCWLPYWITQVCKTPVIKYLSSPQIAVAYTQTLNQNPAAFNHK